MPNVVTKYDIRMGLSSDDTAPVFFEVKPAESR
jgi:hypothetical protein